MNSRVEETIFEGALVLPPEQRVAYLEQACSGDAAMRQRVEALIEAHEKAGAFMTEPAAPIPDRTVCIPLTEKPGDKIGHYKLLQQIGEGGCGVVYMAEQEEPIRRRVAFKVIKLGMDTKQVIARFEAERQALALMDHPNIAKVLDAGAADTGRPYFVMELVRGIKITDYCDQNNLSTEQRLDLFSQVCHAIQHAHQKGIIHRDIKPSNILVTVSDGVPVPKVIDFGIAKATGGQLLTEKTLFTAFEQFVGTPAYMSPEQAEMSGLDIDTRSDIYALGVLLYELLTGKTPFDAKELIQAGLEGMRRIIREQEPARPSTRISTLGAEEQTTIARRRQVEVPKLIHQVRGDLDWIVMKCLEKDRTRRYETANGLAADLERHLGNEPVVARPPGTGYRVGKFVRRHKAKVAFALVVALAIVAAVLGQSVNLVRARRAEAAAKAATEEQKRLLELAEQAQAEAEIGRFRAQLNEQRAQVNARQAEAAASYLRNIFQAGLVRGDDTNFLGQFLDRASLNLAKFGKNEPAAAAGFFSDLALSYKVIGQPGKAEASLREAVRFARQNATNNLPRLGEILLRLANHLQNPELASPERQLEADQLTREAMELLKQGGFSSRDMDSALMQLDYVARLKRFRDRKDELQFYRQWLDLIQNLQGNYARWVGGVQSQLRRLLLEVGPIDEALAAIREQVKFNTAAWGRTNGPWAVITLESKLALAQALHDHNDLAEAETVYREVVADSSEYKRDPGHLAAAASSYSTFLSAAGRYPDAERVLLNAWDQVQRQDPAAPGAEWRHSVAQYLASFYEHWDNAAPQAGKAAKAAEWKAKQSQLAGPVSPAAPQADWTEFWNLNVYREPDKAAEWLQQHPGIVDQSPLEAGNQYESLAGAYSGLAKYDRAETMQREVLRLCRKALTNNPSALADKVLGLALVLTHQNRSNEVEQLASEAVNLIGREPSPIVDTGSALTRLQMLAGEKASNDPEGALRLYRQGADLTRRMPLLKDSGLLVDFVARTRIQLVRLDRWKEAEPTARQAVELTAKVYGDTNCLGARMELAGVLEHLDKLAEAEALYRQVAAGLVPLANDAPGEFNRFISGQGRYRPLDNDPFGKLSRLLLAQGRRVEAERALLDGWSKLQVYPRTTAQQTCEAGQRVLEFYEAWDATAPAAGKAAKVALWKQKLAAFNRAMAENTP